MLLKSLTVLQLNIQINVEITPFQTSSFCMKFELVYSLVFYFFTTGRDDSCI